MKRGSVLKKSCYLIPLLLSSSLWAVNIESVSFKGLVRLSPDTAKEIVGLRVGTPLDIEQVDVAIKKLYLQQYFEDIWVEEDSGHVVINVKEKPVIARIEFVGVGENDKSTIESILGVKKGMMHDIASLEEAKTRIRQFFEAKGYFDTVVEVKDEPLAEDERSLRITFTVNRGEKIIIRSVEMCGAEYLKYKDVELQLGNKEREALGWFWGFNSGELKVHELPLDSDRIKDEYMKKGFLDVEVSAPFLKTYTDSFNASLSYYINEGDIYTVDKISFDAPEGLLDEKALKKTLTLEPNDTMNVERLRKDLVTIETMVADQGYAFVRVFPDVKQDKETKKASITYRVTPGDKVRIRHVRIAGNSRTIDRVIRREMYLTEDSMYSRTDLTDSRNAIRRTGYFQDATIQEERVSRNTMDLLVTVTETNTGAISGGIGYGTANGILLSASVSDGNIFGSGLKGSVGIERSDDELSGRISLTNPRIFDSEYSLGGSLYAEDNEWIDYNEKILGANISLGRKFGRYISAGLLYTLEETKLSGLTQGLLDLGYEEGTSLKSSLTPSISFDNTDDYYLPRSGIDASASLEFAGVGGDEKFLKNQYKFAYFYGLRDEIDYDLILRYKANFAVVWDNGKLPLYERLYLGGISTLRGFKSRSVSPKNSEGKLRGGEISFANSFEASFPLVERLQMRGAAFIDYGMIGDNNLSDETRASAGLSLEWISPLGPIALIFAEPLKKKIGDDTSTFEFTIGRQF
ncbi:MAG: outer membrane protein assembly factor BamA [Campylobacteraceae bacterium]|nr:outer membrane protein assembly factor BamA [Campylobacteraceae bacterium]